MDWIAIILLASAVSFDSLAIGITYGIANVEINLFPRILLSIISACFFILAMTLGTYITQFFSPDFANLLGGSILILLGIYSIWRVFQQPPNSKSRILTESIKDPKLLIDISLFGLMIKIFKQPLAADYDSSKAISIKEALLLGFALALDAFAAGIGAAILSFPIIWTALAVMIVNFLFISKGLHTGKKLETKISLPFRWLPGMIIIVIGILNMIV